MTASYSPGVVSENPVLVVKSSANVSICSEPSIRQSLIPGSPPKWIVKFDPLNWVPRIEIGIGSVLITMVRLFHCAPAPPNVDAFSGSTYAIRVAVSKAPFSTVCGLEPRKVILASSRQTGMRFG